MGTKSSFPTWSSLRSILLLETLSLLQVWALPGSSIHKAAYIRKLALLDIRRICTEGYIWILTHILMWKSCPLFVTSSHLKYFLWHVFVSFKVKPRTVTLVSFSTERLLPDESLNLPDSLPLLPQLSGGWGGKDNDDDDGGGLSLTWNRQ